MVMSKSKLKVKNDKKKEELEEKSEIKSLLKTTIIVLVSFILCYLLFMLMGKLGMFEKGYEKPEADSNEFTYNTAIIGTVFNRPESEYYVSFDEEDGNEYFNTLVRHCIENITVLTDNRIKIKYTLEQAANKVGISKKSLDDYLIQLRIGKFFNFNFTEHKNDKVGILRAFVKKHKPQYEKEKYSIKNESTNSFINKKRKSVHP